MNRDCEIYLASPRGFCAGVVRAIATVKLSLHQHGSPVYVLHEIVHNKHVIDELAQMGAVFVNSLQQVPAGGICIFSAHGVSLAIEEQAKSLKLRTINAICPLVARVHSMVEKYHSQDMDIIIIGHHKHPEVEGTAGRTKGKIHIVATEEEAEQLVVANKDKVGYVTQTTLSSDDIAGIQKILLRRFPNLQGPKSNICFATNNRQKAVKQLAEKTDLIFVVGSKNSSNSNRLKEVAERQGVPAYLIDDYNDIQEDWLVNVSKVGITAGASAPERLIDGVIAYLQTRRACVIHTMPGMEEKVHFQPAVLED